MQGVYSTTRPFWAKTGLTSFLGLGFAIFVSTAFIHLIKTSIEVSLATSVAQNQILHDSIIWIAMALEVILSVVFYNGIIIAYRSRRTGQYPRSYVYSYKRGDIVALGCFVLTCCDDGAMYAEGESYDWCTQYVNDKTKVEWGSLHIGASISEHKITCYILYKVKGNTHTLRTYTHGLLEFSHKENSTGAIDSLSIYTGYLQSAIDSVEEQFTHSLAYAEQVRDTIPSSEETRLKLLRANGPTLVERLTTIESNGVTK
jgi:hypothetical protein